MPQRGNRIRFTALSEGKPTLRRPLLDVNLSRPIIVVYLCESVFEHGKLTASFRGLGQISAAARTDRAAFCFQGHPEASPGPHDIGYLFDRFAKLMSDAQR